MYYTIYKITNKTNGKYYIGKHQTKDLNDGYMGSGKLLRRAIKKHGIDNFTKEILHIFDNESNMNDKEKELVVISEESYNLCPGGHGGFGYINQNNLRMCVSELNKRRLEKFKNDEFKKKFSDSIKKIAKKTHRNRNKQSYSSWHMAGTKSANNKNRKYMTNLQTNHIIACHSDKVEYYMMLGYILGRRMKT